MSDLSEEILKTMDRHHMIGQVGHTDLPDGIDGGDTVNRMGHYGFLIRVIKILFPKVEWIDYLPYTMLSRTYNEKVLGKFECARHPGCYVRHFDPAQGAHGTVAHCGGHYDGVMSRDQTIPVMICLGIYRSSEALWRLFKSHLRRGLLFTTNTVGNGTDWRTAKRKMPDFTGPEVWALYIRGFEPAKWHWRILYWLIFATPLHILDLETMVGSIIWRFKKHDDVINHCSVCIYGMVRMPTLTMVLANKLNSHQRMHDKMVEYWSHWRASPYFVDLYDGPMMRFFGR